jgi:hypothetical protein
MQKEDNQRFSLAQTYETKLHGRCHSVANEKNIELFDYLGLRVCQLRVRAAQGPAAVGISFAVRVDIHGQTIFDKQPAHAQADN